MASLDAQTPAAGNDSSAIRGLPRVSVGRSRPPACDPLRPARGILLGLTLGAACWCCAIGGSVWL